jgi:hypothetical protein
MSHSKLKLLLQLQKLKYIELSDKITIDYSKCVSIEDKISEDVRIELELLNQSLFISFSQLFKIYFFDNELTYINHLIAKLLLDDKKLEILINNYNKNKRIYNSSIWIENLF